MEPGSGKALAGDAGCLIVPRLRLRQDGHPLDQIARQMSVGVWDGREGVAIAVRVIYWIPLNCDHML